MIFSERLRELRLEKGLSQDQLAEKTGLSHGCIAMLEVKKRTPTGITLSTLADFFEVSTDYLLGREDDFGVVHAASPTAELTTEEKNLLDAFRKLNTKNRMHVVAYAEVRLEEQQHETRRA